MTRNFRRLANRPFRKFLILIILATCVFVTRGDADIRTLIPANLCYDWGLDSAFPGAICAEAAICSPEDTAPAAVSFAWGTCPNGVSVANIARSFGSVGSYAVQTQARNMTVYFSEIGSSSETAWCNGYVTDEHVPSDLSKCSFLNPPPGLPPDICFTEGLTCNQEQCDYFGNYWNFAGDYCQLDPPPPCDLYPTTCDDGGAWSFEWCTCVPNVSPILIDVAGNGFALTKAADGVSFNLNNVRGSEKIAWTNRAVRRYYASTRDSTG
jgi:hypothetical protein